MALLDDINRMKKEGKSDIEITTQLKQNGIPQQTIDNALAQSKIKDAVNFPAENQQSANNPEAPQAPQAPQNDSYSQFPQMQQTEQAPQNQNTQQQPQMQQGTNQGAYSGMQPSMLGQQSQTSQSTQNPQAGYDQNQYGTSQIQDSYGAQGQQAQGYGQNPYGGQNYGQDAYGAQDPYGAQGQQGGQAYGQDPYGAQGYGSQDPYATGANGYDAYAQYQPYNQQVSSDIITEISEQVVSEKLSGMHDKLEKAIDFRTVAEAKLTNLSERLKRIEEIIDRLQISILQKVGDYVSDVGDIKKEIRENQESFKALLPKLREIHEEREHKTKVSHTKSSKKKKNHHP